MLALHSAYRANHSTDTSLLNVMTDILRSADSGDLAVLTLLDLSAAFGMVDYETLLHCLKKSYGLGGHVHNWFQSHLSGRSPSVRCGRPLRFAASYRDRFFGRFYFFCTPQICFDWFVHTAWTPPLRWRHTNIWILSAWRQFPAQKSCFWVRRWCGWMDDAVQPTTTKCWQDWEYHLVYFTSTPESYSVYSTRCVQRCHYIRLLSSRSGHLHRLWPFHADVCFHATLRQIRIIRRSVTRPVIGCSSAATLMQLLYDGRSSYATAELTLVGYQCSCSTHVLGL